MIKLKYKENQNELTYKNMKKDGFNMALFGFIGAGNMGYALLNACVRRFGKDEVIYFDVSEEQRDYVFKETGVEPSKGNISVGKGCKYLVLAVKPIYLPYVLDELADVLTKDQVIISIAVGITRDSIGKALPKDIRLIRAMPNTPALLSKGMTGLTFDKDEFNKEEISTIEQFFSAFGRYELVEERLMDAVTCANGSSPAYVYIFIEALADSVVSLGIPRGQAYTLAAQTVFGAAAMVLETGEHPANLKDKVCSPGGTTIAGVNALEEHGFRNAIIKATEACYNKAVSISKENQ